MSYLKEKGSREMLLENLIQVNTNINFNNLILLMKELIDISSENSIKLASIEQSYVTQNEFKKGLNNVKEDVNTVFKETIKKENENFLNLAQTDVRQTVEKELDRQVTVIKTEMLDFKTKQNERIKQLDEKVQDSLSTTINLSNRIEKKVSHMQYCVDSLEARVNNSEELTRDASKEAKKLNSRLDRINQSIQYQAPFKGGSSGGNPNSNTNNNDEDEIITVQDKKKNKSPLTLANKKTAPLDKRNKQINNNAGSSEINKNINNNIEIIETEEDSQESNQKTATIQYNNDKALNEEITINNNSNLENSSEKQLYEKDARQLLKEEISAKIELESPITVQHSIKAIEISTAVDDMAIIKTQSKINDLLEYIDNLKEAISQKIVASKKDLLEETGVNLLNLKKEFDEKLLQKIDKKDIFHLLASKSNAKDIDKLHSDYDFLLSMYARLEKEIQELNEYKFHSKSPQPNANNHNNNNNNFPTTNLRSASAMSSSPPISNLISNFVVDNSEKHMRKRAYSITEDKFDKTSVLHAGFNSKTADRWRNRTVKSERLSPIVVRPSSENGLIDSIGEDDDLNDNNNQDNNSDWEVNLIGTDSKIYRFGTKNAASLLRPKIPDFTSNLDDEGESNKFNNQSKLFPTINNNNNKDMVGRSLNL
ncbi:hypothetical protein ABK040_010599 [Willaertia magna]